MILVIDNYDSFTFNLVQAFGALGATIEVRRNDEIDVAGVAALLPKGVVLSPGPGRPEDAGRCCEIVDAFGESVPMLGVCLGHQAIAVSHGAVVVRAEQVVHGKTTSIEHCGTGLFDGLPDVVNVARYHSLVVERDSLPESFEVTATTRDGLIMGIRHRDLPLEGVQFHPESIATPDGPALLDNFLAACGEPRG